MTDPVAVQRVDHVALALYDMSGAGALLLDALGGVFVKGGDNPLNGLRTVHIGFPGLKVELIQPLRDDSVLSESLRRKGEGLHHVTFIVDDITETDSRLNAHGFTTTGFDAGTPNWAETFIRPQLAYGALLQFVSSSLDWLTPTTSYDFQDVLDGKLVWEDYVPCFAENPGVPA